MGGYQAKQRKQGKGCEADLSCAFSIKKEFLEL